MVLSGSTSPRAEGLDRFYCPPPRRQLLAAAAAAKEAEEKEKSNDKEEMLGSPQKAIAEEGIAEERRVVGSNLERFVASTSLTVPAQFFPRTSMRGRRRNCEIENTPNPYYNLSDLWESFKEWSAYGAGVPLVLNGTDSVVQYYVPFLSAIQLFVGPRRRRTTGEEESDGDSCQEEEEETSSESEREEPIAVRIRERRREEEEDMPSCTHREEEAEAEGGFSSDDISDNDISGNDISGRRQLPVFQYFEHDPPYARQPLADKISTLSTKFPELKMYRSCHLLPSSWISIAWYPIYRIPVGPTLQDLDACFLTFHSLSTTLKSEGIMMHQETDVPSARILRQNSSDISDDLSLPLLGLASYKFKGSIWTSNGPHERELASNLMQSADDWLCSRQVDHPDYRFFLSHYTTRL